MPYSLRNVCLGGPHIFFLGLIKRSYHGLLSKMMSSDAPLFSLASGPPTLTPPLLIPSVTDDLIQNISVTDLMNHLFAIRTFYLDSRVPSNT